MGLNQQQERFCIEFLKDFNATQAYIRAGYVGKGARVSASRMLANANIQKRIQELSKPYLEESGFEIKEWVQEHLNIIQTTPLDALESTGSGFVFKDINDLPKELRGSVKKISFKKGVGMEIELYDKQKSLDALGKWMGVYGEHNKQKKPEFNFPLPTAEKRDIEH